MFIIHTFSFACQSLILASAGKSGYQTYSMPTIGIATNYVTPILPVLPTVTQVLPTPPMTTDPMMNYLNPFDSHLKPPKIVTLPHSSDLTETYQPGDNITVFSIGDIGSPFKTIHAEPPMVSGTNHWFNPSGTKQKDSDSNVKTHTILSKVAHSHPERHVNFVMTGNNKVQDMYHPVALQVPEHHKEMNTVQKQSFEYLDQSKTTISSHEMLKMPSSVNSFNYFLPTHQKHVETVYPSANYQFKHITSPDTFLKPDSKLFFEPVVANRTAYVLFKSDPSSANSLPTNPKNHALSKHVTILKTQDLKTTKPTTAFDAFWTQDMKTQHVLTKEPNPYETVLLREIQSPKATKSAVTSQKLNTLQIPRKSYSAIDLEHLLNQMEVQSEVNRNLGRSADMKQEVAAGQ